MYAIPKKDRQKRDTTPSNSWAFLVYSRFDLVMNKKRITELWRAGYSHKDAAMILFNEQEKLQCTITNSI